MRMMSGLVLALLLAAAPLCVAQQAGEVDRELLVRFSRAYGMASGTLEQHEPGSLSAAERDAKLSNPAALDRRLRQEIDRIIDLNGLERREWQQMLARMDVDAELRQRVDSLSTPFRTQ